MTCWHVGQNGRDCRKTAAGQVINETCRTSPRPGVRTVGAFTGRSLLARPPARTHGPVIVCTAFGLRGLVDLVLPTVTAPPATFAALVC